MAYWNSPAYQMINSVTVTGAFIVVTFDNGDIARIKLKAVLPYIDAQSIKEFDASRVTCSTYELHITYRGESQVIPWDFIRVMSDSKYSMFMAREAERQAAAIGEKLKSMRARRGLSANKVASLTGLSPVTISRIENGKQGLVFATLKKILTVLAYSLRDLADREEGKE